MTSLFEKRLRRGSIFARPAVIFAVVWGTVATLFVFSVVRSGIPIALKTMFLVGGSIVGFFYIEHFTGFWKRSLGSAPLGSHSHAVGQIQEAYIVKLKRILLGIWVGGIALTVVVQGGFPLLWNLTGDGRGYAEFGIPSLNGGLTAVYITLTVLSFRDYLLSGERRHALYALLLLSYCLAIMSRGLMVLLVLNLTGYYLLNRNITLRRALPLALAAVVGLYLMNFVAENRSYDGKDATRQFIVDTSEGVFEESVWGDFKRGWKWVEMYGTAPLGNLNFNIDTIEPHYYPNYTLRPLFPSIVRERIFRMERQEYEVRYALQMVNNAFNTFTFYANYLRDFGLWGCVGILLIVQVLACRYYHMATSGDLAAGVGYAGIFAALVLSPFTDYFGTLIIIAQIAIAAYIRSGLRRAVGGVRAGRARPRAAGPTGDASPRSKPSRAT